MFKDLLKQVADERGMNNAVLAKALDVAPASVGYYLSGKVNPPDKKKEQFALSLGLDADFFKRGEIDKDIAVIGYKLPIDMAARLMGISDDTLRKGLQDGVFPFGYAVKTSKKWTFWISAPRFTQETGIPVPMK